MPAKLKKIANWHVAEKIAVFLVARTQGISSEEIGYHKQVRACHRTFLY